MEMIFYYLRIGRSRQYYVAEFEGKTPEEYIRGMGRGFKGTAKLRIVMGGKPGDLLDCPPYYFISERVIRVLEENKFQSYETHPTEVIGGKGDLPKYYGITFLGRGGPTPLEKCDVRYGPPNEDGTRSIYGMKRLIIDPDKWDGSDLLYVDQFPGRKIVTERVKIAFQKAKLTNFYFDPIDEPWGIPPDDDC